MPGDGEGSSVPRIVIESFDPGRYDRLGFSCGTDRLDNFLRLSARKQQKDDFTRVFVAVVEGSTEVLGYYALNAHAVATDELGADRPRRAPRTGSIPALYLSMIAVDKHHQGMGLGSDLAIDALGRALGFISEAKMILGGGVNGKPKSDSSCVSLLPQALCHVRVFLRDHKFAVIENYSNSDNPGAKVSLYEGQGVQGLDHQNPWPQ